MAQVVIVMGSQSDYSLMEPAATVLTELGISCEVRVVSAHRTPQRAVELASTAQDSGVRVFICGAGGAAHLAGVIAAHTLLPVIGVPLSRTLGGLDSLYATVQMPPGIPVATVAIDGAQNAGLLAAHMMALCDADLLERLRARRGAMAEKVRDADDDVRSRAPKV